MYLVVSMVLWGQFLVIAPHFTNLQEHGKKPSLGGCVLGINGGAVGPNSIVCGEKIIMVG